MIDIYLLNLELFERHLYSKSAHYMDEILLKKKISVVSTLKPFNPGSIPIVITPLGQRPIYTVLFLGQYLYLVINWDI